jgi:hypothetical protein
VTKGRCTSGNLDISTQMARDADEVAIWNSFYIVCLTPRSWVPQMSEGVRLIAGLMRDNTAVLGAVANERIRIRRTLIETTGKFAISFQY